MTSAMYSEESPTTFSAEEYFATQPPPSTLDHDIKTVREFVARQNREGRNVVLVTSGGTTVPLELNVVRFLDNFSAGTRGATSAEYFLQAGYAVIFMHRQFSLQPFSRHYSHSTNPFLDFLQIEPPKSPRTHDGDGTNAHNGETDGGGSGTASPPEICVTRAMRADLLEVLTAYKSVHAAGTLLTLTFVTVNDYLWLLRALSHELAALGRHALYYLAAAVSDFFLPRQRMSEHKIQSGKGSLHIEMDQVPKILKPMVDEWSKEAFIVSFKLETDPELLIPKARAALERYGHQVVIGNDLHRRKFEVVFVSRKLSPSRPPPTSHPLRDGARLSGPESPPFGFLESWLRIDPSSTSPTTHHPKEIEEDIVAELVRRHQLWIQGKD